MKRETWSRDSMLTVGALVVMVPVFLLGVFVPGMRKNSELRTELRRLENEVQNVPVRIAELEMLRAQAAVRQNYLKRSLAAVPVGTDDHVLIGDLHRMADRAGVRLSELTPGETTDREFSSESAFVLNLRGRFESVAVFLRELERHPRIFHVERLTLLASGTGQTGGEITVEAVLQTYSCSVEFIDSDGNADRDATGQADTRSAESPHAARIVTAPNPTVN